MPTSVKDPLKEEMLKKYGVFYTDSKGNGRISFVRLAKMIIHEHDFHFTTIVDDSTNKHEIFYYEDGYYHPDGDTKIKEMVTYFLNDDSNINRRNETLEYIRYVSPKVNRVDIEPPVNLINFHNGIYDIDKDIMLPHDPQYIFINQIPWDYDSTKDCPLIKEFISQVIYSRDIPTLQEAFGFCFLRVYTLRSAFLFLGGGANGKGIMVELLSRMLGRGNFSTRKLHDLADDKFAKASLFGKFANIGGEISGKALKDTSDFKLITGGEPICGEKKFMGDFTFQNYAKLFFNANTIPRSNYDKSDAFFSRWIIISFPHTFSPDDPKTMDRDALISRIATKEEMEGLVAWGISGLRRLRANGRFTLPYDEEEKISRYNMMARNEYAFIEEYLSYDVSHYEKIDTDEIYNEYKKWAEERFYSVLSKIALSRSIKKIFNKVGIEVTKKDGKSTRMYTGLCWIKMPDHTDVSKTITLEAFESSVTNKERDFQRERMYEKATDDEKDPSEPNVRGDLY